MHNTITRILINPIQLKGRFNPELQDLKLVSPVILELFLKDKEVAAASNITIKFTLNKRIEIFYFKK